MPKAGLFIPQFLTEQNGGRIQLNSKAGAGTTFLLDFPLAQGITGKQLAHVGLPVSG